MVVEAETLSLRWGWSERHSTGAGRGLVNLIAAARAEPRPAQLYPFTSHYMLRLSACMPFPCRVVAPQVEPMRDGRFRVHASRSAALIGTTDTAEEAVALVLQHLPADVGPAQDTNADLPKPLLGARNAEAGREFVAEVSCTATFSARAPEDRPHPAPTTPKAWCRTGPGAVEDASPGPEGP